MTQDQPPQQQQQQQPSDNKVIIIQSVLGWLANITPIKALTIMMIAIAGSAITVAIKIQDPKWKAANLFPDGVTRERIPGGCILQTFHFQDEPDVVLIYRFSARGEAIYNIGFEADFLKSDNAAESACVTLKTIVDRLERSK